MLQIGNANAQAIDSELKFSISMDNPGTHYFHVEMQCAGLQQEEYLFKMPAWTPGYYWILNLAKNVCNFEVKNSKGDDIEWAKTANDTWLVKAEKDENLTLSYDVFAYQRSVAEPWLDDGRAFISPTGVFLYIDGLLNHQVQVTVEPYKNWPSLTTGLAKLENEKHTFIANNFDQLYDCPILAGNLEVLSFNLNDIPYTIAMENPADFNRETYINDFKKIAKSATEIIGDVPYDKYAFLIMDKGYGGLEHSNSMAVFSNTNYDITNSKGYKDWLSFIAHEFFHLYNVKTIRPINLGPFNYSKENLTHMLWVAEGFTVYYEYMVLNRAGLLSRTEVLAALSSTFATFENAYGRKCLSARQASFDTWLNFFNWNNHTDNTTISYYDIGCALGMLLDLKIRQETNNEKSLDDVMRTLYFEFHKKQNRGYTDDEFREVCEKIAGCTLGEIFRYAETTDAIDYQKYLWYAGVNINLAPQKETSYGLDVRAKGDVWEITNINRNSPAWGTGISIDDCILSINGEAVNSEIITKLTQPEKIGTLTLKVKRRTGEKEFKIDTFDSKRCDYKMSVAEELTTMQKRILDSWIQD